MAITQNARSNDPTADSKESPDNSRSWASRLGSLWAAIVLIGGCGGGNSNPTTTTDASGGQANNATGGTPGGGSNNVGGGGSHAGGSPSSAGGSTVGCFSKALPRAAPFCRWRDQHRRFERLLHIEFRLQRLLEPRSSDISARLRESNGQ